LGLALARSQAKVDDLPSAPGGDAVGTENQPLLNPSGPFDLEGNAIQDEVAVDIGQGPAVEACNFLIQAAGHPRDGLRRGGLAQDGSQDLPHPTGAYPSQEHLADELVYLLLAPLIPLDNGGAIIPFPVPGHP